MSSRRRQTPWMHRWSRLIIGAIAILGALNTGYITVTKLFGGEAACPTEGCQQVLSSPYAYLFGLPLSLSGLLAYVGMACFALVPLLINEEANRALRKNLENWTWLLLFIGSTAMLVFSGYLMYIMVTEFVAVNGIQSICFYCIASAILAAGLFLFTILGRSWDDVGQLFFTGVIVSVVVLVGALGVYANVNTPSLADSTTAGQAGPPVTTTSGPAEIALAQHLTEVGAKMYGAYWCPHCHDQKQLFGQQAARQIDYVECDPTGQNPQRSLCEQAGVTGYPTWEINGQLYPGTQSLENLAELSGYQGPTNFQS